MARVLSVEGVIDGPVVRSSTPGSTPLASSGSPELGFLRGDEG